MATYNVFTAADWHAFYRDWVEVVVRRNDIDEYQPHVYLIEREGEFECLDPCALEITIRSDLAGLQAITQSLDGYRSFGFVVPTWEAEGMVGLVARSHPLGREVLLLTTGEANRLTIELGHIDRAGYADDRPLGATRARPDRRCAGNAPRGRLVTSGVLVG